MQATEPGIQWYRDFKCKHCDGVLVGNDEGQLKHESDCPTLLEYSEILLLNPEAVMEEDLVPVGKPYAFIDNERIEMTS